jgi:hypothetical protein
MRHFAIVVAFLAGGLCMSVWSQASRGPDVADGRCLYCGTEVREGGN